jgi:molybdopterin converting factor small subunit
MLYGKAVLLSLRKAGVRNVQVTMRYFSIISDLTKKRQESVEVKDGTTLAALRASFMEQYKVGPDVPLHICVNGRGIVPAEFSGFQLKDDDIVMFLPPMSGG